MFGECLGVFMCDSVFGQNMFGCVSGLFFRLEHDVVKHFSNKIVWTNERRRSVASF